MVAWLHCAISPVGKTYCIAAYLSDTLTRGPDVEASLDVVREETATLLKSISSTFVFEFAA